MDQIHYLRPTSSKQSGGLLHSLGQGPAQSVWKDNGLQTGPSVNETDSCGRFEVLGCSSDGKRFLLSTGQP